jgi:hypothetical protein
MIIFPFQRGAPEGAHHAAPYGEIVSIGPQGAGAGKAMSRTLRALLAAALLVLAACSKPPPEEALRKTIDKMMEDGEAHRVSAVMDSVAEDFVGPNGMSQQELRRMLTFISMRHKSLGVTIGPMDVKLIGERATAKFTLGASGGSGGLIPDSGQIYEVTTGWKLVDGDWKLISADWNERL